VIFHLLLEKNNNLVRLKKIVVKTMKHRFKEVVVVDRLKKKKEFIGD
jgi:hypothetical protein